jgi:hypothetical protein
MKVGSWEDAIAELKASRLQPGSGVSAGTVQYLLARCYRELGQLPEETAALSLAVKSVGAQLTVDGPLISELVKREKEAGRIR